KPRREAHRWPRGRPRPGRRGTGAGRESGGAKSTRRGASVILEGIVTTLNSQDMLNVAPMGPEVAAGPDMDRFILRPYRTSTTYPNLKARGEGVLHVTDDVLLLAQAAIGVELEPFPTIRPASMVAGAILADACRFYEFRVVELDDRDDRTRIV